MGQPGGEFFLAQSMVKDDGQRALLYDLDRNILKTRATLGEDHEIVLSLTSTYHNLLRQWAEL